MSKLITYTGQLVDLQEPDIFTIDIEDIAHALSQLCRFAGHTREFYSVAQHSVIVSQQVEPKNALSGLLHDAAEAYMVDLPRPLKDLLPDYRVIEKSLERAIFKHFGLTNTAIPEEVEVVDKRLVITEAIELGLRPQLWARPLQPLAVTITPLPPKEAKALFLDRFNELKKYTPHFAG